MLAAAQQHGGFNPYPAKYGTVSVNLGERTANVPWEGEVSVPFNANPKHWM
jgi:hypothetical protein